MQKLTTRREHSRTAVMSSLENGLPHLFNHRAAMISKMSGYPTPLQALGRLRAMLNFSDIGALLSSIHTVQQICNITAEVIESMDATNVNKFQINRTDVETYVANIVSVRRGYVPSETEIDVISNIITSSEANPGAWVLSQGDGVDNMHLKFLELYRSVMLLDEPSTLPVYVAHSNDFVPFHTLPKYAKKSKNVKKKGEKANDVEELMDKDVVIYQYSLVRIIDHIYQLMMDKDIWYQFMAPRKVADVVSNLERARSLKVFGLYLQSVLTYHQFFSLEMFLASYELIQKWIANFPSLTTEQTNKIESTIRAHDYLGARADANHLLISLGADAKVAHNALSVPEEFIVDYGFMAKVDEIVDAVGGLAIPTDIMDIKQLNNPIYTPLTADTSTGAFDVVYDLTALLVRHSLVKVVVDEALLGLIPAITGGSSKAALSGLTNLNIKCTIPFEIPSATTFEVTSGVVKELRNGKLALDSAAPQYSREFHRLLRDEFSYRLFVDGAMPTFYKHFNLGMVIDADRAAELRSLTEYNWQSLIPSFLGVGDRGYDMKYFTSSEDSVRGLVEMVTGQSHEMIVRQLSADHMRAMFATYLSGFALVYFIAGDARPLSPSTKEYTPESVNGKVRLVAGHGRPFGKSFTELEQLQGAITPETTLLPLGYGIYVRLLTKIPTPITDLVFDSTSFYNGYPYAYFASGNHTMEVTEWVLGDGLWNYALLPVIGTYNVPLAKFTPRFSYMTTNLYLNLDPYYKPSVPAIARETVNIPLVAQEWPYDRLDYWLKYIHFGAYGTPLAPDAPKDDTVLIADAIKDIEKQIKADAQEEAASSAAAGTAAKDVANKTTDEIKKANERLKKDGISDDDEIATI